MGRIRAGASVQVCPGSRGVSKVSLLEHLVHTGISLLDLSGTTDARTIRREWISFAMAFVIVQCSRVLIGPLADRGMLLRLRLRSLPADSGGS